MLIWDQVLHDGHGISTLNHSSCSILITHGKLSLDLQDRRLQIIGSSYHTKSSILSGTQCMEYKSIKILIHPAD